MSERFEPERRGLAIGIFHSGSFLGTIVTTPFVVALIHSWGWRYMFVGIGAIGFLWVWMWVSFRGNKLPRQSPALPPTERSATPPRNIPTEKKVWGPFSAAF